MVYPRVALAAEVYHPNRVIPARNAMVNNLAEAVAALALPVALNNYFALATKKTLGVPPAFVADRAQPRDRGWMATIAGLRKQCPLLHDRILAWRTGSETIFLCLNNNY